MKIKTSELTGPALRYAVAVASGRFDAWITDPLRPGISIKDVGLGEHNKLVVYVPKRKGTICKQEPYAPYEPDTDWAQGGPIIEREWLDLTPWPNESDESLR